MCIAGKALVCQSIAAAAAAAAAAGCAAAVMLLTDSAVQHGMSQQ
jgi:hypothetical protein